MIRLRDRKRPHFVSSRISPMFNLCKIKISQDGTYARVHDCSFVGTPINYVVIFVALPLPIFYATGQNIQRKILNE